MKERRSISYSKMPKFNQFKNRNKLIVFMYLILWGICWTLYPNIYGGFKNWSQTTSFLFLSKWKMKKQFWKMSDWEFLLSRTFIFRSVMLSCFALVQEFFFINCVKSKSKSEQQNQKWLFLEADSQNLRICYTACWVRGSE